MTRRFKRFLRMLGKNFQQFTLSPTFIIKDGMVAMPAFESEETGY
jgi:cytochrome c-type biogenesis protein CcmF